MIKSTVKLKNETGHPSPDSVMHYSISEDLVIDTLKKKLVIDAEDCFRIIYSSLQSYYQGNLYMFKPIAGQLRILYCDTKRGKLNSVLYRIHQDIKLLAFNMPEINHIDYLQIMAPPFSVIEKANGIQTAKIFISYPVNYLSLEEWIKQIIDFEPEINIWDIIRCIADKGGGSHIDNDDGTKLSAMKRKGPKKIGVNVLFIIALAHYTLRFGNQIIPYWNNKVKI